LEGGRSDNIVSALGLGRCDEEQGTQLTETLKVGTTILLELMFYGLEVAQTVTDDRAALLVESFLAVQEIDDAAADHRVECHQRSLKVGRDARPAVLLMRFP
jgi:hypothetical protein